MIRDYTTQNKALCLLMLDYGWWLAHFGQHDPVVVGLNRVSNLHAIKGAADIIDSLLYCFISEILLANLDGNLVGHGSCISWHRAI